MDSETPEVDLDGLIRSIREEGIADADREKERIIAAARDRANSILESARAEVASMRDRASRELEREREAAYQSLRLAARDLALAARHSLLQLAEAAFEREVSDRLSSEAFVSLIVDVAGRFVDQNAAADSVEVLLSEGELSALSSTILESLRKEVSQKVEISVAPDLARGFRIRRRGEAFAYEFTESSIADALKSYVSPHVAELLGTVELDREPDGGSDG